MKKKIIVLAGPTAVGKTEYAIDIAKAFNGEIVSCDSMQIYKFMDIGSAKPSLEERGKATHHLVDFLDPNTSFSVAEYQALAKEVIEDILNRGKMPIVAGGTGLYLDSILFPMNFANISKDSSIRKKYEELAKLNGKAYVYNILKNKNSSMADDIHPNNLVKVIRALEIIELGKEKEEFSKLRKKTAHYDALLVGLNRDRNRLYDRINLRVDLMLEEGLLAEVKSLLDMGIDKSSTAMQAIGYKELIQHIEGEISIEEAVDKIKQNTRRYAKRQLTWFKRYDNMKWFTLPENSKEEVIKWLQKRI